MRSSMRVATMEARAFVHFQIALGEQVQMHWVLFRQVGGKRLCGFALALSWYRIEEVEFASYDAVASGTWL